jgi:hypothetical protein
VRQGKLRFMADPGDWTDVGVVEVESGTCLVVDPTFHRDGFYDAERVGQAILDAIGSPTLVAPLALSDGHEIGTVIRPGYGDDAYRVEVRYIADEGGTRRIAELRLRFIEDA